MGFCGAVLPSLLHGTYHGPLVVAVDSSVLVDLQMHGVEVLEQDVRVAESKYRAELEALGWILDLWLLRDIRFVVPPRAKSDARTGHVPTSREPAIDAIEQSLAFQLDFPEKWPEPASLEPGIEVLGLPAGGDLDLVQEALGLRASVFLTRDYTVIRRADIKGAAMRVISPKTLAAELRRAGVSHFTGGICRAPGCPYLTTRIPGPDLGKWSGLLSHFC